MDFATTVPHYVKWTSPQRSHIMSSGLRHNGPTLCQVDLATTVPHYVKWTSPQRSHIMSSGPRHNGPTLCQVDFATTVPHYVKWTSPQRSHIMSSGLRHNGPTLCQVDFATTVPRYVKWTSPQRSHIMSSGPRHNHPSSLDQVNFARLSQLSGSVFGNTEHLNSIASRLCPTLIASSSVTTVAAQHFCSGPALHAPSGDRREQLETVSLRLCYQRGPGLLDTEYFDGRVTRNRYSRLHWNVAT